MIISIDFETRSTANLPEVGVYKYVEDRQTDVWCMAWKIDDGPVEIWKAGEDFPWDPTEISGAGFSAWNAGFERTVWNAIMSVKHGWPKVPLSMWDDTAAAAAYMALPRALEKAAGVLLGPEFQKDMAGSRLCLQMAKPRKVHPGGSVEWWTSPNKLDSLYAYCKQDVVVESAIREKVWEHFPEEEKEIWRLDQRMNDHGALVDVQSAIAAQALSEVAEGGISRDMNRLTGGVVEACSNTGGLLTWVRSKGLITDTVNREWVRDHMNDPALAKEVREVLALRYAGGKASLGKLKKFIKVPLEGSSRACGLLMYYGADTGRWAGRLIQPQNLPRGEIKINPDSELLYELIREGNEEVITLLYGAPMTVISAALRGLFRAPPKHDLISVDYASIEAAVLAWLAGEQRVLDILGGHGKVYEDMASQIYGIPIDQVTGSQRANGKVGVLGCGYQMGWETLMGYGAGMGIIITEEEAKAIVNGYRALNPNIRNFWPRLNNAAIQAVAKPNQRVHVGKVSFIQKGWYLRMRLPSGRELFYADPTLVQKALPWTLDREKYPAGPEYQTCVKIWHVSSLNYKWQPRILYGGLLAENATQAVARDVMVTGMVALDKHPDYTPILTVHDEIIMEVPSNTGSLEEVMTLMTTLDPWAEGLPISASGWRGTRYRKD
jgi:DNA polymerase